MEIRLLPSPRSLLTTRRQLHSSNPSLSSQPPPHRPLPASKWLSDTKSRIGKCISFGLSPQQTAELAPTLRILAKEWRSLVAGREGFLVDKKRAGLVGQKVVWGEMDSMGHVNNVMYVRYAESARVGWVNNFAVHLDPGHKMEWEELYTPKGVGMILRSIKIDYKFPMTWPDKITVCHKLRELPSKEASSFLLDVMIVSESKQRVAARCEEDIVVYDYKQGVKVPVRPWMMEGFKRVWGEQEGERERVIGRIQEIEEVVGRLEKESWDKEGAVEDMGGR